MEGHALANVGYQGDLNEAATKDYVDTELLFLMGSAEFQADLEKLRTLPLPQKLMT